jgi:hypothetical protein
MSECGICGHAGRHVHYCVRCGERVTLRAADWRVSTLGEPRVEHFTCRRVAGSPGFGLGCRVL